MGRRTVLNFVGALALCAAAAVSAAAQDFQRTYNLESGGSVEIENVSGDVNLTGYEGSAVVVNAYKEGRDRDMVEVEDVSTQGHVSLRAKYPNNCNCEASVRFEVRVPRSANLVFDKISTASGNVKAEGFTGRLHLSTASGDVTVRGVGGEIKAASASGTVRVVDATGTVNASTASGDVEVELTRLEGAGDMRFSSASGDVHVRMPTNIDARVSMSTASGDIETNFPIEVKHERNGSGTRAEGQLGSGARMLKISSASGNVSLKSI
ncbi:MAG: hypothetical protein QOH49_4748 [Acidobacteriota bacterium]|jgi:DUF4097 and DUF4098 domain-containing protein YvlB|nr:hypothetical protein [Acidobacteriota bacterium]